MHVRSPQHKSHHDNPAYFRQEAYSCAAPFSSFLPGIAGLYGKPLWCYYVNRGQAVACFGTQDKDHGIMPFQSANLHYARVEQEGFRTLVRWQDAEGAWQGYEPFRAAVAAERTLTVTPDSLHLEERSEAMGLAFAVAYTTVPGEACAALLRTVTITNISETSRRLEWVDGFANLIPYGLDHHASQNAPFICQGYLHIDGLGEGMPFFRFLDAPSYLHVIPERPVGNVYFAFGDDEKACLPVVVDRDRIFGEGGNLAHPTAFFAGDPMDLASQKTACMAAAAFAHVQSELAPGESAIVHSLCGAADSFDAAVSFRTRALQPGWVAEKKAESSIEVGKIRHRFFLHSGDETLNAYVPQTFLDNVLRGGLPITLQAGCKSHTLHVFNRVHGDLERDYNAFKLDPTYFSQGNGHYRDANQNRRNDVWFNPEVGTGNLHSFFNLLRLDGYNPMACQGVVFRLDDGVEVKALVGKLVEETGVSALRETLAGVLGGEFTPGALLGALETGGCPRSAWAGLLEQVLAQATIREKAAYGTGFWIDHWFYCFDQLDRFLALFPDRLADALLHDRGYTYWEDAHRVLPRSERYLRVGDPLVHQVGTPVVDSEKQTWLDARTHHPHQVRTANGEIHRTNLLEKIFCLILNKVATIAPSGFGVEMEAGHPGWHDSINRLPYQFGSSTSELFQLQRAVRMTLSCLGEVEPPVQTWPEELVTFLDAVERSVTEHGSSPFAYWQAANEAKERYRSRTWSGLSGDTTRVEAERLRRFLERLDSFLDDMTQRVMDPDSGLPFTYYLHRPEKWEIQIDAKGQPLLSPDGHPRVNVLSFESEPLPLFLEAPVHALRTLKNADEADALCGALRSSVLFDGKLKMYLLGDSLKRFGLTAGRIGMWTPGWFENENIFLHMEHKLLVSMFESGRYERLFATMRDIMIPFQPPERYGRSPIENTSFIVSSRHPAPERHGRGYLPRSSGTTAEVLDLFLRMSFGDRPFRMKNGQLAFELDPVLPDWIFSTHESRRSRVCPDGDIRDLTFAANTYAALLLSKTLVVYHNPDRLSTYGDCGARVASMRLIKADGTERTVEGARVDGVEASKIRDGDYERIEVLLNVSDAAKPVSENSWRCSGERSKDPRSFDNQQDEVATT